MGGEEEDIAERGLQLKLLSFPNEENSEGRGVMNRPGSHITEDVKFRFTGKEGTPHTCVDDNGSKFILTPVRKAHGYTSYTMYLMTCPSQPKFQGTFRVGSKPARRQVKALGAPAAVDAPALDTPKRKRPKGQRRKKAVKKAVKAKRRKPAGKGKRRKPAGK